MLFRLGWVVGTGWVGELGCRVCVYRAPCGGGAEKRNLLAPSPRCCMQRRATTAYRLPVPLGTPPLLNV